MLELCVMIWIGFDLCNDFYRVLDNLRIFLFGELDGAPRTFLPFLEGAFELCYRNKHSSQ